MSSFTGEVLSASGPDNMTATLASSIPIDQPLSTTDHVLDATGSTGHGANRGDFNEITDLFGTLEIPTAFDVRTLDASTCTAGPIDVTSASCPGALGLTIRDGATWTRGTTRTTTSRRARRPPTWARSSSR